MPPKGGDKITPSWESLDSLLKIQIVESHPPAIFLSPLAILIQQVWRDLHFFFFLQPLCIFLMWVFPNPILMPLRNITGKGEAFAKAGYVSSNLTSTTLLTVQSWELEENRECLLINQKTMYLFKPHNNIECFHELWILPIGLWGRQERYFTNSLP